MIKEINRRPVRDLKDYKLSDLRSRIALVAQDTYLFNDTLRQNILIANPPATWESPYGEDTTIMAGDGRWANSNRR